MEVLQIFSAVSQILYLILKTWWWLWLPIILYFPLKFIYFWWVRWDIWYKEQNWILLEIKPPKEILKPFKAMEDVFSVLWGIIDTPNWRERWCFGEIPLGGGLWFSFEIASLGGEIHFYMRIPKPFRNTAESTIYSHYPEAEISVVDDYTKNVPQDVPNKNWDFYGEDFQLIKEDIYPIKTYAQFFEERAEVPKEEKRIDPLDSLLEHMSKLREGEQVWIQIVTNPITNELIQIETRGKEVVDRLVHRPKKEEKSILGETARVLITGKPPFAEEEKKEVPIIPPEMKLTPGEREIVQGIEDKIKKPAFQTWIRTIYLIKKDAPYFWPNYKIARAYFGHFGTRNLNSIKFWNATRTRIHYWFKGRRLYLRKRNIFRHYVRRLPPLWPWSMRGKHPLSLWPWYGGKGTFVLNIEELATIFHFPSRIMVPTVPYVEAKKGGPPPTIPIE